MARLCRSFCFIAALLDQTLAAANWPYWTYTTAPFQPPNLNISVAGGSTPDPGYIFLGPRGNQPNGTAALIYDQAGNLVYQGPDEVTANVNVQTLFGQPVLTFWTGDMLAIGYGYGKVHILDNTYKEIYTVSLPGDFVTPSGTAEPSYIDLHESKITERNTMLVTAYNITQANLTAVGGPADGWMLASHFFEIDIATNEVVFSWNALDYQDQIPLTLSHQPIDTSGQSQSDPWDAYHINSVDAVEDGYLVSLRHLWSAFYLHQNGSIKWRLSGDTGGDFNLGPGCNFSWQHHIRAHEEDEDGLKLSIFNNANADPAHPQSPTTGLVLHVDLVNMSVTNFRTLTDDSDPIYASSQGDTQLLDGTTGHVFMDYGAIALVREYDSSGNVILSGQFGSPNDVASYRGFKYNWQATPFWDPAVVVDNSSGSIDVYMSWNGATDYDTWDIYGGPSQGEVNARLLTTVARTGFETKATLSGHNVRFIQALARGGGDSIRASTAIPL
ncbi:hypothetical protein VTN77DRAFT_6408 [Rasamsonia byssochlamydoides]|uniref:uncharacterized protein n=1 Tax=Rasamsonia byssochlamydoides TaxID=89139 RepID=UPI0037424944